MGDVSYARYMNTQAEKYYATSLQIDSTQLEIQEQLRKIAWRRQQILQAQQDTLSKTSNFVEQKAAKDEKKDTVKNKLFKVW